MSRDREAACAMAGHLWMQNKGASAGAAEPGDQQRSPEQVNLGQSRMKGLGAVVYGDRKQGGLGDATKVKKPKVLYC